MNVYTREMDVNVLTRTALTETEYPNLHYHNNVVSIMWLENVAIYIHGAFVDHKRPHKTTNVDSQGQHLCIF